MRKIPFSPPDITGDEINEVIDTLKSGWITTGPKTKELENRIAAYIGVRKAVCLNSATACLETVLRILGIGEGDEVIVPAYTYTASASPVHHVGAKIVMIDSMKDSIEMDYNLLNDLINEKTKAIIPVDIAGIPCDYDKLFEIVEAKKNLFKPNNPIQSDIGRVAIVADSAHSFGAKRKGVMSGNIADFSSFSFHAVKNLTTAEGGAFVWRKLKTVEDDEIYKKAQLYSLHGQSKDALAKMKLGSWEYDIVGPWYKNNMTDIMASLGLAQLNRYKGLLEKRKNIADKYDKAFKGSNIYPLKHSDALYESSRHLYITRIDRITETERNEIIVELAKEGISSNVHYKPLPMMSAYRNLGFDIADFPNAYEHYKNEITLPLHTKLSDEDVDYIIKKYIEIVKKYEK